MCHTYGPRMAPRIGITMTPTSIRDRSVEALNRSYADAVLRAGGVPFLLPQLEPEHVETVLDCLDGVLLSGGGDVDPARYGAERAPEVDQVDDGRDRWELALAATTLRRGLPVLAICRGAQVLNVARGGTLVQHLPHLTDIAHRVEDRCSEPVHRVSVEPDSLLATVLGSTSVGVNSLHHQAVDVVGSELRAVAWAEDGTVEAVEGTGRHRILAVQWHPELLIDDSAHVALFDWLVDEAVRGVTVRPLIPNGDLVDDVSAEERAVA